MAAKQEEKAKTTPRRKATDPFEKNMDWPVRREIIKMLPDQGGSLPESVTRHNIRAAVDITKAEKDAVGWKEIELVDPTGSYLGRYSTWEKPEIVVAGSPIELSPRDVRYLLTLGELKLTEKTFPDALLLLFQEMDKWLPRAKKKAEQEEERMSWQE